jgi:hypothetical protein
MCHGLSEVQGRMRVTGKVIEGNGQWVMGMKQEEEQDQVTLQEYIDKSEVQGRMRVTGR